MRRWHPPGRGWIRTLDYGDLAVWMRPEPAGVGIAVYTGDGFGHLRPGVAETWVAHVDHTSPLPSVVMDKPHRIRWAIDPANGPEYYVASSVHRRPVDACHRGHRRLSQRRRVWRWPLPRPIRAALEGSR